MHQDVNQTKINSTFHQLRGSRSHMSVKFADHQGYADPRLTNTGNLNVNKNSVLIDKPRWQKTMIVTFLKIRQYLPVVNRRFERRRYHIK